MKTSPTNAISSLLQGLRSSQERVAQSAEKIANGDISADSMVELKQGEREVLTQAKALGFVSDLEDRVLDILA